MTELCLKTGARKCLLSLTAAILFSTGAAYAAELTTLTDGNGPAKYRQLLDKYCVGCHNETLKTAGLMLDQADTADVTGNPELWERVIVKLSLRAMPPVGMPVRPSESEYKDLLAYLQGSLDGAARANPNPGRPAVHRLNRSEYANAIRDLLALEIDPEALLPPDNRVSGGFDNIAEVLSVSPLLMERYMFAAGRISRMAVGDRNAVPANGLIIHTTLGCGSTTVTSMALTFGTIPRTSLRKRRTVMAPSNTGW